MKRIYVVKTDNGADRLVRAANRVQAENFVARDIVRGKVATQDELVKLASSGVTVEEASSEVQADLGD